MDTDASFQKQILLIVTFFVFTPIALAVSLFTLFYLSQPNVHPAGIILAKDQSENNRVSILSAYEYQNLSVDGEVLYADARVEIIRQYLEKYNSPLYPYADLIVKTADKYGLDFRLITAIAQQESNLCKRIPPDTYNCWGWGIHSKGTLGFSSFEEGIEVVSRGLKQNYIDKGFNTIEQIMSKYTPASTGSWAKGVSTFMAEMQ